MDSESNKVIVVVKPHGELPILKNSLEVCLNVDDDLHKIRNELRKEYIHAINDSISFVSRDKCEIPYEIEKRKILRDIVDIVDESNTFYLMQSKMLNWRVFKDKFRLDYGCTMSFDGIKRAENKAFMVNGCKLEEINKYEKCKLTFGSKEDWMEKTNLFFSTSINIQNFVEFGISVEGSQNKNFNKEVNSTYQYTELGKVSLKLDIGLTDSFKKYVVELVNDKNSGEFKEIINDYGQFIPTEVILGGRIYYKNVQNLRGNAVDNSGGASLYASVRNSDINAGYNFNNSESNSEFYSFNEMKLLGGKFDDEKSEGGWIKSLENFELWDCIEFRAPKSIFKLLLECLPENLHRQDIFKTIGKRILYSNIIIKENHIYNGNSRWIELEDVDEQVVKILRDEDADHNTFATVLDVERQNNDHSFFSFPSPKESFICQVYEPLTLMIHPSKTNNKNGRYVLKIRLTIIGYDTNFKDIYSDPLHVETKEFNAQTPTISISFNYNNHGNQLVKKICLGSPVIRQLDELTRYVIIGHHFYNAQEENIIETRIFSYCSKGQKYVDLPRFTFYALILNSKDCERFSFERKLFHRRHYIKNDYLKPMHFSLYISRKDDYKPFFLAIKNEKVKEVHLNCSCGKTCFICINKKPITSDDACIFFDPEVC